MINIVDAIMGEGKTTAAIAYMNENSTERFIYVAPYLSETERIKEACPALHFQLPDNEMFGSKYAHFRWLVLRGENVCITHELFKCLCTDLCEHLKAYHYTLVLDEELEVIENYEIKEGDWKLMLDSNLATTAEDGYWKWIDREYDGRLAEIKRLMDRHSLEKYGEKTAIWKLPAENLKAFDNVYVLTYMFLGSVMDAYCQMEGLTYEYYHIEETGFVKGYKAAKKERIRRLISIYEGKLNTVGDATNALSKSWCDKNTRMPLLKNNIYNYFHNIESSPSKFNMWSCFKKKQRYLKGNGYARGFVPFNTRATNDYSNKKVLAYVVNSYLNPVIVQYVRKHEVELNSDTFALSCMLQWIWRSQIRNGKPIDIYIPSKRMRDLMIEWLYNEI